MYIIICVRVCELSNIYYGWCSKKTHICVHIKAQLAIGYYKLLC